IVFLVRKGNPKGIRDWDDLTKPGVEIITPNPKTSGGARWNYLAAWAYAHEKFNGDEAKVREFVTKIIRNVPVLDSGARGSTTTFVQRGIGDVLLAWENEAFLALNEFGAGKFEIVVPSISILAQPPVTTVGGDAQPAGSQKGAGAYRASLYSPCAQERAAKHDHRPCRQQYAHPEALPRVPEVQPVTSDSAFGGWQNAQKT